MTMSSSSARQVLAADPFHRYTLEAVRPDSRLLVSVQCFGQQQIVTLLDTRGGSGGSVGEGETIVAQALFSGSELSLLLPLVTSLPDYCPYEVLYASFFYGSSSAQAIERARETILDLMDEGGPAGDSMVRPLRNVMSRVRLKLRPFGLEVTAFLHTGYLLQPLGKSYRGSSRREMQAQQE